MGEAKRRQSAGEPSPLQHRQRQRQGLVWGGAVLVLAILVGGAFWLSSPDLGPSVALPEAAEGAGPFPSEFDRFATQLGSPDAPVVVREFADYQCPACAAFATVHPRLKSEYIDSGKVRLVFFELPLAQHRHALVAAQAARCAGDQGDYWGMHDRLFEQQSVWSNASDPTRLLLDFADDQGLHKIRFERCLTREHQLEAVQNSLGVARQLRIASTPTVIVNNVSLTRPGWEHLSGVIEQQLQGQP